MTKQRAQRNNNFHEELAELCRSSYVAYASVMRPEYQVYAHTAKVNALLEDVADGLVTRYIIAMPPRHGKSMNDSETHPAYMFGRNPNMKTIQSAYGSDLAEDFGRSVLTQMQSPMYKSIWGFGVSPVVRAAKRFHTGNRGIYVAAGIDGPIVGRGANHLKVDDPIKSREEAESKTYRNHVKTWFQAAAYDRLEDFEDGQPNIIGVCATRWHMNDLSGWLMSELADENWVYLSLPAVTDIHGKPCSPFDEGAVPLWPEQYPIERYQRIRNVVGSYEWDCKYQQNPTPAEGSIIKLEWFRRYTTLPRVSKCVQSWDTAEKKEVTSAYSVCGTWKVASGRYYQTDVYRKKLLYPDLKRQVINMAERDNPEAILIEDKSSGVQLIQDLRRDSSLPIIAIEPENSKIVRAATQSALVEAGLCFLPERAPWLADFESEIRDFPTGDYADQVDQLSQFLAWQRNKGDSLAIASTGARDSATFGVSGSGFASI